MGHRLPVFQQWAVLVVQNLSRNDGTAALHQHHCKNSSSYTYHQYSKSKCSGSDSRSGGVRNNQFNYSTKELKEIM